MSTVDDLLIEAAINLMHKVGPKFEEEIENKKKKREEKKKNKNKDEE